MTAPERTSALCHECGRPASSGRFCTGCGTPLPVDPPTVTLAELLSSDPSDAPSPLWSEVEAPAPWLDPEPAPPARRRRDALAVLVLGALVLSGWSILGGVEEHTLSGTVTLVDTTYIGTEPGDECFGADGYDDLNAGAQVVVADEEGTTLSTGRLSAGEYDGVGCVFSFELADVTRAAFYALSVAGENRGELQYSYDELADGDWSVELSLGED